MYTRSRMFFFKCRGISPEFKRRKRLISKRLKKNENVWLPPLPPVSDILGLLQRFNWRWFRCAHRKSMLDARRVQLQEPSVNCYCIWQDGTEFMMVLPLILKYGNIVYEYCTIDMSEPFLIIQKVFCAPSFLEQCRRGGQTLLLFPENSMEPMWLMASVPWQAIGHQPPSRKLDDNWSYHHLNLCP